MKTVMTVVGIRPDFIRMSAIFKLLDANFNHVLVHTGQHFEYKLSDMFFEELNIRDPDFTLCCGGVGKAHYHVAAEVSAKIIDGVIRGGYVDPDIILFLGDSNSVLCSVALKKEGFRIGHIEAGMRSGDKRMLEEINRTVCDHCSDFHFVYHEDYEQNLLKENLPGSGIHVVGNTIVEVCKPLANSLWMKKKSGDSILMDIHRPENFENRERMTEILRYANLCSNRYGIPVKFLRFKRTMRAIQYYELESEIGGIQFINLMSYKEFLSAQYHSLFMISDSGTAQEEPVLLNTPVVVPRDFTERPQSMRANCSYLLRIDNRKNWDSSLDWVDRLVDGLGTMDDIWLGDGHTAKKIINVLKDKL